MASDGKKRKQKFNVITHDMAVLIETCRKYFESETRSGQRNLLSQPLKRTAACLNISKQTIVNVRRKLQNGEPFNDDKIRERYGCL